MKYKHYSFDLWGTLIKSNPEFNHMKRAQYFHDHFNRNKWSVEEVNRVIRKACVMIDNTNIITGYCINNFQQLGIMLQMLEYPIDNLLPRDIQSIYHNVAQIFKENPPIAFDDNTVKMLYKIRESGATISVLSNTGFMSGITMNAVMADMEIMPYLNRLFFSDLIGCSKPSVHAYSYMAEALMAMRRHNPIKLTDIIHIGDNAVADKPENNYIDHFIINTNEKTILDIP